MKTIAIQITIPDGAEIQIGALSDESSNSDAVSDYYANYLSPNGKRLYAAAASIEVERGPGFTFDDIGEALDVSYQAAQSYHRNSGGSAKRWEREKGTPAPIVLEDISYEWDEEKEGMRSKYKLPEGVAAEVAAAS